MPRNGSGVYSLPAGNPVITGTVISSTTQNSTMSDVASELTNSIAADGQKTPTANLPMGNFRHTGVLNANSRDQYSAVGQVQDGSFLWCGTAAGTANALTFSPIPAITAYVAGQVFRFKSGAAANTGATTVAISGLVAIALQSNGAACVGGEIASNQWYETQLTSATEAQLRKVGFQTLSETLGNANANLTTALNDKRSTVALTATTSPIWTAGVGRVIDGTGTPIITDFPAAPQAGSQREIYPGVGTTITNGGNISVQGNAAYIAAAGDKLLITAITTTAFYVEIFKKDGQSTSLPSSKLQTINVALAANAATLTLNPTILDFRSATLASGTINTRTISTAISTVISSGSTGGTVNAVASRIILLAIDNAGTAELAWVNQAGGNNLDETTLISTTAEGGSGAADSASTIYSTTARTNVPFRVVGYFDSTQTIAGTWSSAISTIQGYGGQALSALSSFGNGQTWQNLTASRALSTTYYNTTGKTIVVRIYNVSGSLIFTIGGQAINAANTAGAETNSIEVPPGNSYSIASSSAIINWYELR